MHTDEYEISISREIAVCQNVIGRIHRANEKRAKKYGLLVDSAENAQGLSKKEREKWLEDLQALPVWEQRLCEYKEALAAMRISAARKEY